MKKEIKVSFKVAMDAEQKKLKNFEKVEFTVVFPEGIEEQVQSDALAHQVVKYQSQIRSNWDTFLEKGVPKEITYGNPLYGTRRGGVRAPTDAEIENYMGKKIAALTPEQLQEFVKTGNFPE